MFYLVRKMQDFDKAIDITLQTYQRIATHYTAIHATSTGPSFWQSCMRHFSEIVSENPLYQHALPVVDAGCGPGRDSLLLAQMGFQVIATDLSEAMLDEARKHCNDQPGGDRIAFRCMDMRSFDLPDASCAGLWVSASLLHIPKHENQAVLHEFRRVLVPGGALMLLVKECDGGADERFETHQPSGERRFFARYRGSELWELLEQTRFLPLEITTARDGRYSHMQRWLGALAIVQ